MFYLKELKDCINKSWCYYIYVKNSFFILHFFLLFLAYMYDAHNTVQRFGVCTIIIISFFYILFIYLI